MEVQKGCYDPEITTEKQIKSLLATTSLLLIDHFHTIDTTPYLA